MTSVTVRSAAVRNMIRKVMIFFIEVIFCNYVTNLTKKSIKSIENYALQMMVLILFILVISMSIITPKKEQLASPNMYL